MHIYVYMRTHSPCFEFSSHVFPHLSWPLAFSVAFSPEHELSSEPTPRCSASELAEPGAVL